jgi:hypothetical protein
MLGGSLCFFKERVDRYMDRAQVGIQTLRLQVLKKLTKKPDLTLDWRFTKIIEPVLTLDPSSRVMELMLEIKRCNCFKERDRANLNCVELGLRRFFFWIWFVRRLHL